jgi:predicted nucleotidyltransferase
MTMLQALQSKRLEIHSVVARHRAANPRVFGSVAQGTASEASDYDILVDALPGATMFDLGGLQIELEQLLGRQVDLLTPRELPPAIRQDVLANALPI